MGADTIGLRMSFAHRPLGGAAKRVESAWDARLRKPFVGPRCAVDMDKTRVQQISGYALVALGVLLYAVFGLARGSPMDVGVYSITVIPIVFGLGTIWIASGKATSH